MCPCEFPVPTNAHVCIDYACEVLYVILPLNYIKLINTPGPREVVVSMQKSFFVLPRLLFSSVVVVLKWSAAQVW